MAFIAHYRGQDQLALALLSDDVEVAGDEIRIFLANNEEDILPTDTIFPSGEADFGDTYTLLLPPAIYRGPTIEDGLPPARWLTHTTIDRIGPAEAPLKGSDTAGFTFTSYVRFENFYIGGDCSNIHEDGGLLSWQDAYHAPGVAEFYNCEIDASGGMDWGIYSWENNANAHRKVKMTDCVLRFCRFGVALAGFGDAWQSVEMIRVQGIGNANGSRSLGASSSRGLLVNDYDQGTALSLVYNRGSSSSSGDGPYIRMEDSTSVCTGLAEQYSELYGCPRIAALATNCYEFGLQRENPPRANGNYKTDHTSEFIRCSPSITPGISEEVYFIDIRERSGTPVIREINAMATVYLTAPSGNSNLRIVFTSGGQYLRAGNGVLEAFGAVADYRVAAAGSDTLTSGLARYRFTVPTPAVLPVSLDYSIHDIATDELVGVGTIHLNTEGVETELNFHGPLEVQYPEGTLGEAYSAARADGFGQMVLDASLKKLRLKGHDNATTVREFDLDSAITPQSRT